MSTKETIALVVNSRVVCDELIRAIAVAQYRLLLVAENEPLIKSVVADIREGHPNADIEIISCVKEGCWEADIIVLIGEDEDKDSLIKRIREVSTQKIVVGIFIEMSNANRSSIETGDLKLLLPHSKIVQLIYNHESKTAFIGGEDIEASKTILALANKIGFKAEKVITI